MPFDETEQKRRYQREWLIKRREAWLEKNGPCARCGSWKELQLDHKDSGKKVSHKIWSWNEKRRTAELAKCQVLCSGCHRLKTEANLESNYKLPREKVAQIKALYARGWGSHRQLAREFGCSHAQIRRIVTGKQRADVEPAR